MNRLEQTRKRVEPPLSRNKLAALAGVDGQTIYRLEKAGARPQLATALALARVLSERLDEELRVEDLFPEPKEAA